jgi:hypothetical protein
MNAATLHRVSYDLGCLRSLKKLPDRVSAKFLDMMTRFMSDPSAHGLNFESVKGTHDRGAKSVRIDQSYRAIAFVTGPNIMFLHVNAHDDAYRWAEAQRPLGHERDSVVETVGSKGSKRPICSRNPGRTSLALGVLAKSFPRSGSCATGTP